MRLVSSEYHSNWSAAALVSPLDSARGLPVSIDINAAMSSTRSRINSATRRILAARSHVPVLRQMAKPSLAAARASSMSASVAAAIEPMAFSVAGSVTIRVPLSEAARQSPRMNRFMSWYISTLSSNVRLQVSGLDIAHPIPDVPRAVGPHGRDLMMPGIDRDVQQREAIVGECLLQRRLQFRLGMAAMKRFDARHGPCHLDVVHLNGIVGAEFTPILRKLQSGDRGHAAIVKKRNHAAHTMLYRIDENLRVHHEGPITGKRDAVLGVIDIGRPQQRRAREPHVGRPRFRECLTGRVVFHDLKSVGLHVARIKEFYRAFGIGERRHRVDCRRLRQYGALPDFVGNGCGVDPL